MTIEIFWVLSVLSKKIKLHYTCFIVFFIGLAMTKNSDTDLISQADIDNLLRINEFIEQHDENSL